VSKKNTVQITVAGYTDTGKSTVIMEIYNALIARGFKVNIQSDDEYCYNMDNNLQLERLHALRVREVTINIEEKPLYDKPIGSS